jgi:hypothetical protein
MCKLAMIIKFLCVEYMNDIKLLNSMLSLFTVISHCEMTVNNDSICVTVEQSRKGNRHLSCLCKIYHSSCIFESIRSHAYDVA